MQDLRGSDRPQTSAEQGKRCECGVKEDPSVQELFYQSLVCVSVLSARLPQIKSARKRLNKWQITVELNLGIYLLKKPIF